MEASDARCLKELETENAKLKRLLAESHLDNGPEVISKALDEWAYRRDVRLNFIEPSKPVQNAFVESFNGSFSDECQNEH